MVTHFGKANPFCLSYKVVQFLFFYSVLVFENVVALSVAFPFYGSDSSRWNFFEGVIKFFILIRRNICYRSFMNPCTCLSFCSQ